MSNTGRGANLVITPELQKLGIGNRDDLDRLCLHSSDPGLNLYLFLKLRESGTQLQFVCANPDARPPPKYHPEGYRPPHLVWYPYTLVAQLKRDFMAGGFPSDSFEAEAFKWRNYGRDFRSFLHHHFKEVKREKQQAKVIDQNQLRLEKVC